MFGEKWLRRMTLYDDEPSGGGSAPDAATPSDGAPPTSTAAAVSSDAVSGQAADAPPAAGVPDAVQRALWGAPQNQMWGEPQGQPQGQPWGQPQGQPWGQQMAPGQASPYLVKDPGPPTQEQWDENFEAAQAQYADHIRARALESVRPMFDALENKILETRGMSDGDRRGRMLTSIQTAATDLERRGYDQASGVIASNPHYRNNPKVKEVADWLVAEQMNRAVQFAAATGNTMPLANATSRKTLRQTLMLALDEAGVDLLGDGGARASVRGAELVHSGGPGASGKTAKALDQETVEIWKKHYSHLSEADFRKHMGL